MAFPDVQDTPYLQASTVTGHDFGSCESLWDHGDCKPGCTGRVDSAGTGTTFWLHQGGVVRRLPARQFVLENYSSRKHLEAEKNLSDFLVASKAQSWCTLWRTGNVSILFFCATPVQAENPSFHFPLLFGRSKMEQMAFTTLNHYTDVRLYYSSCRCYSHYPGFLSPEFLSEKEMWRKLMDQRI